MLLQEYFHVTRGVHSLQRAKSAVDLISLCSFGKSDNPRVVAQAPWHGDDRMRSFWTRDYLMRRIDRCYLIAAWTRTAEKRKAHLELARYYRYLLAVMSARARIVEAI